LKIWCNNQKNFKRTIKENKNEFKDKKKKKKKKIKKKKYYVPGLVINDKEPINEERDNNISFNKIKQDYEEVVDSIKTIEEESRIEVSKEIIKQVLNMEEEKNEN